MPFLLLQGAHLHYVTLIVTVTLLDIATFETAVLADLQLVFVVICMAICVTVDCDFKLNSK